MFPSQSEGVWCRVCPYMFDVCLFVGLHIDVPLQSLHSDSRLDLDGLQGEGRGEGRGRGGEGRGTHKVCILLPASEHKA